MGSDVPESEKTESVDSAEEGSNFSLEELTTAASLSAKEAERNRIQAEIEEFLNKGGEITRVDTNVMTDPPKAPESNYGGQPI